MRDGQVVKGVKFRDHRVVGDILELAVRYRDEGADELVFYDISASPEGRTVDRSWITRVARILDIPFCVAGGIRTVVGAEIHALAAREIGRTGTEDFVRGDERARHDHDDEYPQYPLCCLRFHVASVLGKGRDRKSVV